MVGDRGSVGGRIPPETETETGTEIDVVNEIGTGTGTVGQIVAGTAVTEGLPIPDVRLAPELQRKPMDKDRLPGRILEVSTRSRRWPWQPGKAGTALTARFRLRRGKDSTTAALVPS